MKGFSLVKPLDIVDLKTITGIAMHPHEPRGVWAVQQPNVDANAYVGQLHAIDDQGKSRQLTYGQCDSHPKFNRTGDLLGFLSRDLEGKSQVRVLSSAMGESVQPADLPLGCADFDFSADGSLLVVIAERPEDGRYGTVKGLRPQSEAPRLITTRRWYSNGRGYLQNKPLSLAFISLGELSLGPAASAAPGEQRWTGSDAPAAWAWCDVPELSDQNEPPVQWESAQFSLDGTALLAIGNAHKGRDLNLRKDLYRIPLEPGADGAFPAAGTPKCLTGQFGNFDVSGFAQLADGRIFLSMTDLDEDVYDAEAHDSFIAILDGAKLTRLTEPKTTDIGFDGHLALAGERAVLAGDKQHGLVTLVTVSDDGAITPVIDDAVSMTAWDAAAGTGRILAAYASETESAVLQGIGFAGDRTKSISSVANVVIAPRTAIITGRGGYPVEGWIYTPAGTGTCPVILWIHGGPFAASGPTVFDEAQVLVGAGYGVVICNPRGSAGYGEAHGQSVKGVLGTIDMEDITDFFDAALESEERFDSEDVGIMGGSYGGYMTAWMIGHTQRFKAAIVERGMLDPGLMFGTSDIGDWFNAKLCGTSAEDLARQSPMAYVSEVKTPTLVIHSENDHRCPISQGLQFYNRLKRQGTYANMLIFPGETHELTRSGQPRHRVERFEYVLQWWKQWLG
ncbi:alpha/beta hydrolase family protein [Bifidobacterium sp.]|jgi:dipeptidyl aminopeptidase/acylaminoacyl peptidase|uniref:alpha/beta hydrolase family protein n=1 Tax=Bifidobacterium sp. TaxID=41200 RepID=UPI0025BEBD6A|nr:S9 family peptidase [Bifidobacterium sp.]MCI1224782.1 S9 family peptidase [Bifidobacterium sp.]